MKRSICVLLLSLLCKGPFVVAGVFDCESEMKVNTVFGNRVPYTESVAKKAGWTKMSDISGAGFHSPLLSLIRGKLQYPFEAPGVLAANLKNMVMSKLKGEAWTEAQWIDVGDVIDSQLGINHKYISPDGRHEAVYDPNTEKLINQGRYMGTYNKDSPNESWWMHIRSAVEPHWRCVLNGEYMWDPTQKCFVIGSDGKEIEVDCETGEPGTSPGMNSQTYTIDNTAMKQCLTQQLEGAYQYASVLASEAGVGAEYQSAVVPAMSQGRAAISSMPDEQTVTIPTGVQQ